MTMSGGLGNQLFQVAASIYIEEFLKREVVFNVSNLVGKLKNDPGNYTRNLEILELIKNRALITNKPHWALDIMKTNLKKKFFSEFYVFEKTLESRAILDLSNKTRGVFGFFQDSEITQYAWPILQARMQNSLKFSNLVSSNPLSQIAMHIRFGDYSDDPKTKKAYGLTRKSYYLSGLQEFRNQQNCPTKLVIVTDDIKKAKDLIKPEDFLGILEFVSNPSAIEDLNVLARSSHLIISNSTFSWWGAWIAFKVHNSKVIFPRPWFANKSDPDLPIYVNDWFSIKREFETS